MQRANHLSSQALKAKPSPAILSTQPRNPNWRESTSLIITAKDDHSSSDQQFNYSVLMVKRSGGSSFMPSTFVFPGGRVELSDFDTKWYLLYAKYGLSPATLDESIGRDITGPRPPIVTSPLSAREVINSKQTILNPEIALRITAIRETFEEAGVLLLTAPEERHQDCTPTQLSSADLSTWQLRVRNDGSSFFDLCDSLQMVPNIWHLHEWTNWLTPTNNHNKRYDTIFYMVCLPRRPDVVVDNAEVTMPMWTSPLSILEEHHKDQVFVAPPQVWEMSRMLHFSHLDQLQHFALSRQRQGLERWMPVVTALNDGTLFFLPGDERYPEAPEMIANEPIPSLDSTVDEQEAVSCKNLTVMRDGHFESVCTVEPICGHKQPIRFSGTFTAQ